MESVRRGDLRIVPTHNTQYFFFLGGKGSVRPQKSTNSHAARFHMEAEGASQTDTRTDIEILIVRTSITRNTQCYVKLIGTFHTFSHWYFFFLSGGVPPRTPPGKVLGMDVKFYY